jgi:hypothetical protein
MSDREDIVWVCVSWVIGLAFVCTLLAIGIEKCVCTPPDPAVTSMETERAGQYAGKAGGLE